MQLIHDFSPIILRFLQLCGDKKIQPCPGGQLIMSDNGSIVTFGGCMDFNGKLYAISCNHGLSNGTPLGSSYQPLQIKENNHLANIIECSHNMIFSERLQLSNEDPQRNVYDIAWMTKTTKNCKGNIDVMKCEPRERCDPLPGEQIIVVGGMTGILVTGVITNIATSVYLPFLSIA